MRMWVLAALLSATLVGETSAMHLDPGGVGQVLLSPHYTVNAGHQTLVTIVNHSDQGKALKVRFLEGRNARQVLEFNLYLAPHDLWTGSVFSLSEDGPANLTTLDRSCTVPEILNNTLLPQTSNGRRYAPFYNFSFGFSNDDAGPNDLARTREGFFEVIEMGTVINDAQQSLNDISPGDDGIPANCRRLGRAWSFGGYWEATPEVDLLPPTGDLTLNVVLVHTLDGTMYSFAGEAIDHFSSIVQHTIPGDPLPNLASAVSDPALAVVDAHIRIDGQPYTARYPQSRAIDAVSALFMASSIENEFNNNVASGARSSWVLTFPTKRYYTDDALLEGAAIAPFTRRFSESETTAQNPASHVIFPPDLLSGTVSPAPRGEQVAIAVRNREGYVEEFCVPCFLFSPPVVGTSPSLNWASNVLGFGVRDASLKDALFGSRLNQYVEAESFGIAEGSTRIAFYDPEGEYSLPQHLLRADESGQRLGGLPVIGFWAVSFTNLNLVPGVLSNYASAQRLRVSNGPVSTP